MRSATAVVSCRPTSRDRSRADSSVATAYSWRFLVVAAAIGVAIWVVIQLKLLVIPLMVAILVTALLWPAFSWMLRHRVPRWAGDRHFDRRHARDRGRSDLARGLAGHPAVVFRPDPHGRGDGPVPAVPDRRPAAPDRGPDRRPALAGAGPFCRSRPSCCCRARSRSAPLSATSPTGALLSLFILLCLLADGGGIWRWTTRLFPNEARPAVDGSARAGWVMVVNYARTQLMVATIDAAGIGLGAFLLGVPLAIPVAVLVFLGAFVPIVGAVFTGTLAVFLALVYNGPLDRPVDARRRPGRPADRRPCAAAPPDGLGREGAPARGRARRRRRRDDRRHPRCAVRCAFRRVRQRRRRLPRRSRVGDGGAATVQRPDLETVPRPRRTSVRDASATRRPRSPNSRMPRPTSMVSSRAPRSTSRSISPRCWACPSPQAREPPAHGLVQDPRCDVPAVAADRRGARARRRGRLRRQPRAGRGARGAGARHPGDDLHAAGRAGAQAARDPRLRRRRRPRRGHRRDAAAARGGVRRAHRRRASSTRSTTATSSSARARSASSCSTTSPTSTPSCSASAAAV